MQAIDSSWGVHREDRVHVEFVKTVFLEVRFFFQWRNLVTRDERARNVSAWHKKGEKLRRHKKASVRILFCTEHFNIKHDHLLGKKWLHYWWFMVYLHLLLYWYQFQIRNISCYPTTAILRPDRYYGKKFRFALFFLSFSSIVNANLVAKFREKGKKSETINTVIAFLTYS